MIIDNYFRNFTTLMQPSKKVARLFITKHDQLIDNGSRKDSKLVQQCMAHSRDAQYMLYKNYNKAMYNLCLRIVGDQSDAEDVLQVAFVQVFTKIKEYRFESTLGAWIKRIGSQ